MQRLPSMRQSGAALLLLLLALGLGASAMLMAGFNNRLNTAHETRSLEQLAAAKEALLGYAQLHGRLPRPAMSALDGRENPQVCASDAACTGFIPWVTLGIDGVDGWGNLLRYSVTPAYALGAIDPLVARPDKRIMGRSANNAPYFKQGTPECQREQLCPPAVIIATGKTGPAVGTLGNQRAVTGVANTDEAHNFSASNYFVSRSATVTSPAPDGDFDDVVEWIPLKMLYHRMSSAGSLH